MTVSIPVYIIDIWFYKARFQPLKVFGILVSIAGVALISLLGKSSQDEMNNNYYGFIFIVIPMIAFVMMEFSLKFMDKNYFTCQYTDPIVFSGNYYIFVSQMSGEEIPGSIYFANLCAWGNFVQ